MKKIQLLTLLLTSFIVNTFAQKYSETFGSPTLEEVQQTKWPNDTIAEAAVIYDIGESRFLTNSENTDFEIYFERSTKIKILTQAGVEYANIEIPLYHNDTEYETIKYIDAYVYNCDNGLSKTTLDFKQIYQEEINKNWSVKKFALPNVKPGSVIEYRYTVITPFKFNLPDWEFQWRIPVRKSKYIAHIVPFYEYGFVFQGASKFDEQKSTISPNEENFHGVKYKQMVHEYTLYNIKPFRDEEYITSINDYIKKIDFQLVKTTNLQGVSQSVIGSWEELAKEELKDPTFGKYINACEKLGTSLSFENPKDTLATIKQAIQYIKSNYTWNQSYFFEARKTLKEFTTQNTGNSANINLMLVGLLRSKGINANPVLISTRSHGTIKVNYPMMSAFNNVIVIVNVNNKNLLLDACDPFCAYDNIPADCINEKGFVVNENKTNQWVYLNKNLKSDITHNIDIKLDPENSTIESNISTLASYMDAAQLRKDLTDDSKVVKKQLYHELVVDSFDIVDLNNPDTKLKINATTSGDLESAGNQIIVHPFLGMTPTTNEFKAETRDYPVDLNYNYSRRFNSKITLPQGYKVSSLPSNFTLNDPLMSINMTVAVQPDNTIFVGSYFAFNKAIYQPEEYKKLKNLYNLMISKLNAPIIIEPETGSQETAAVSQ